MYKYKTATNQFIALTPRNIHRQATTQICKSGIMYLVLRINFLCTIFTECEALQHVDLKLIPVLKDDER